MAVATAAKAKLLLRELKTLKSDLAYAKERCSQLEEENRMLRETGQKGDHHDDDDMVIPNSVELCLKSLPGFNLVILSMTFGDVIWPFRD